MKKALIITALLFSQAALADTITYDVEGMHCGSCAKSIKAQVCKMDGLEKCEVSMGKIVITPKAGISITQDQVQSAVTEAGEYKVTGSKTSK